MLQRPQLKLSFLPVLPGSKRVFLLSEAGHFLLHGETACLLAPLLDGRHTTTEIVERLRGQLEPDEVLDALRHMERLGYIIEAPGNVPREQAAFWDLVDIDAHDAADRLFAATITVEACGGVSAEPIVALLGELCPGTSIQEGHSDAGLHVVITDDYLRPELEEQNRRALASGRPWLPVKPVGVELWIGPLFVPGRTGCWSCLAHRLQGARKIERHLRDNEGVTSALLVPGASLPSTRTLALALAATEITKWIAGGRSDTLEGKVVTLNTRSLETGSHRLVRRPQCVSCGDPWPFAARDRAELKLQRREKHFATDGGHRTVSPSETFERYEHHISHVTGVITRFSRSGGQRPLGDPIRCFSAVHNFVHMNDDIFRQDLGRESGGRGKTLEQARASALSEALERYSGVFQGYEARIRASLTELGESGVHPNACMCVSDRQIAQRAEWNKTCSTSSWVPEPFDPEAQVEWSPVWSLARSEIRYVPTALCYHEYAWKNGVRFAHADSNGTAAGNNLEEAILHGLMELVERDAVALWWYNRLRRPGVDLESFGERYLLELRAHYASLRRDLWVLDITSDLGIPVFAAISRRNDKEVEDITLGFGAHVDPNIAILRAVTELNQSLPSVIDVDASGDDGYLPGNPEAIRWWKGARLATARYLAPREGAPAKVRDDYPDLATSDLRDDILRCVGVAAAKGLDVLVLDQTRPDIGLNVVRVIVPGLRSFWARFGPGRLYDVPVAMRDLAASLTEVELNPYLIYL